LKTKDLIIIFNIILIIIILITTLLPVMLMGREITSNFMYMTLPLQIFMVLLLVCVNIFFFLNYRLFSLLEREDWPALSYYLEQKIYVEGKYSTRKVRLLAGSYLVITDYASVLKLEYKTRSAKPSVIKKNVLVFGAARILNGEQKEAAAFFETYLDKVRGKDKQWVRWFYGFSLLLSGAFSLAESEFLILAASSDDILITGLSAYFLENSIANRSVKADECTAIAKNGKDRVVNAVKNAGGWIKEANRVGTEIHIAIIRKYINEAGNWLFPGNK